MQQSWVAESGSTKTTWVCIDDPDQMPLRTSGLNPNYRSVADLAATLTEELPEDMRAQLGTLSFYGAGCAGDGPRRTMKAVLGAVFENATQLTVEHDLLGAALGLCGGKPGLVGILGTGSHACYFDGERIAAEAVSLGYMIGDEGSGADMGKRLVQDFFYQQMPVEVADAFSAYLALTREELIERIYRQPWPNRFLASLAPFLTRYMEHDYGNRLISNAFGHYVRLHIKPMAGQGGVVHFTGSIAYYFKPVLRAVLQQAGLEIGLVEPDVTQALASYFRQLR